MVRAALAISGIFDLEPIRGTTLNEKLALTNEEIARLSPIRLPPPATPLAVAYGTGELPELQRQSREFHASRGVAGGPGFWCRSRARTTSTSWRSSREGRSAPRRGGELLGA